MQIYKTIDAFFVKKIGRKIRFFALLECIKNTIIDSYQAS